MEPSFASCENATLLGGFACHFALDFCLNTIFTSFCVEFCAEAVRGYRPEDGAIFDGYEGVLTNAPT